MQTGRIGECSEEQLKVLQELKDYIKNELRVDNPIFDDWYLLRFCRSRKFNLKDVIAMFKKFLEFRETINADQILKSVKRNKPFAKIYSKHQQSVYFCTDKVGRPVKIDRWDAFDKKNMLGKVPKKETLELFTKQIECDLHCIYPYMSMLEGRRIDSTVIIHDLKDFGLTQTFDSEFKDWFSMLAKAAQDNYPEMLAESYVVNGPFIVNIAWAIAKTFLNEKTRKKIHILGSSYQKTLLKAIDKDK